MKYKPPPKELVQTRPAVELESPDIPQNPEQGPYLGPPPRLYSRALHDAIIKHIENGNRPQIAAAMAGLPSNTYYRWMQQGRQGHPHYWEFAEDVERAMAVAEGKAVSVIAGADGSFSVEPEHAKWWLERTRTDGYSKEANAKLQAMAEDFFKRIETNLPAVITPEMVGQSVFQMVLAAAAGQAIAATKPTFELTSGSEEEDGE